MVGPRGWQRARPNIQKSMEDDAPDGRAADADEGELSMRAITKIVLAGTLIGAAVADGKGTCECSILLPPTALRLRWRANLERLSAGLHGTGRQLRTLSRSRRRRMEYLERLSAGLHRTGRQLRTLSRSNRLPAATMVWLLNSSGRRLSPYLIGRRLADPSAMPGFCRENFPLRMQFQWALRAIISLVAIAMMIIGGIASH
jgi:hypothetical protein